MEPDKQSLLPHFSSLSRLMSIVMLMFGILAVGLLFYQLMVGFFVPLFLAALLVVIFRPVHAWLLQRTKQRRRLAAGTVTAMILFVVLLPVAILVSVAATQFTLLVSQVNFKDLSKALDRTRERFALTLPHPDHFRALDALTNQINFALTSEQPLDVTRTADNAEKAVAIIQFLQADVDGPPAAAAAAQTAIESLQRFSTLLRDVENRAVDSQAAADPESLVRLNAQERFEESSVVATASVRSWMHTLLGGTLRSQLRLIANPSEADFMVLIRQARDALTPRFVGLTSATGSVLGKTLFGLMILVVSVYFFLIDGAGMIHHIMRLSPMDDDYEQKLLTEFDRTSRAVVLASMLSALAQGVLAVLGFWMCGFDQLLLLFFLTTVMSLIPFLGAASIWVPCVLWLGLVDERWTAALLLGIYGGAIVSSMDNLVKMLVLQGRSQLHPLLALLSVIGGVGVFGPIGILVGPMVVVFLQTLLEILQHEIQAEDAS